MGVIFGSPEHALKGDGRLPLPQEPRPGPVHAEGVLDDDDRVEAAHVLEPVPLGAASPRGLKIRERALD